MQVIKTGANSVDELYGIDFTGNVIPHSWYEAIILSNLSRKNMVLSVLLLSITTTI